MAVNSNKVVGYHRSMTHSLVVPIVILVLMCVMYKLLLTHRYILIFIDSLLFGFEVGWVKHVFADLFKGKGYDDYKSLYDKRK